MKFSIIINTHNQTHHIHKSIISCINQKYKNFEIIVVDSSKKGFHKKILENINQNISTLNIFLLDR